MSLLHKKVPDAAQQLKPAFNSAWYATAMERLVAVVQALSRARSMETIHEIVLRASRDLTGADGASFVLREGDQCYYADENAIGPLWKGKRFPLSTCVSGWVMLNHESVFIKDIYHDPRVPIDAYRPTFVKSMAMVPIRHDDPVGAIGNYWATTRHFSLEELRVLQVLADTTSVAIENVELRDNLEMNTRLLQAREACVDL